MKLQPIAFLNSPYKQKFAIPRQPNLVKQAVGEIVFEAGFSDPNMLRGLEEFSHLWLIFLFHETADEGWNPIIHPPRLGGHGKRGVFATRSTHRPNPVGLSVVERGEWHQLGKRLSLQVRGIDLLDGTPILDIKPYLPYADTVPAASGGFAPEAPALVGVAFSPEAESDIDSLAPQYPGLRDFIAAVLAQDPRPAYRRKPDDDKRYGISLYDLNIKWRRTGETFTVISVKPWNQENSG